MTTPVAVGGFRAPAPNPADEADLVPRLRAGDETAYEELFRTHSGALLAVARRYFGGTDDAAEAVQDAFVSAFRAMRAFQGTSRLGTWLHRITVNACLMRLRSRRRCRHVSLSEVPAHRSAAAADPTDRAEVVARVRAGIARLPDAYRRVVELRDIEGIDTATTAIRLGTNEGVVKVRLHRARQALRELLEPATELAG